MSTSIALPSQDNIRSDDILVVARRQAFPATKTLAPYHATTTYGATTSLSSYAARRSQ
ncbi:MAG: hypothetical protein K2F78_06490 [Muribaculaceae bacterium]|nr:hypothetical protein [Muribaculaceae bacterium]